MKRVLIPFLFGLFVFPGAMFLAGCGGTETGNPARHPQDPALALMDAICEKLTECFEDLALSDCRSAIAASTTLAGAFGLHDSGFPTYLDLVVETGSLRADHGALDQCLDSIEALACEDPAIQAIQIVDGSIANLEQMIPTEGCPDVFSEVERDRSP